MSFLTINAHAYEVQLQGAVEKEKLRFGSETWSFSAKLRSQVRVERGTWAFALGPMSQSDFATLRSDTALGAFVDCAGDALGGTVKCRVVVLDAPYLKDGKTGEVMRIAPVVLTETGT